jgi:hypothetical protein
MLSLKIFASGPLISGGYIAALAPLMRLRYRIIAKWSPGPALAMQCFVTALAAGMPASGTTSTCDCRRPTVCVQLFLFLPPRSGTSSPW